MEQLNDGLAGLAEQLRRKRSGWHWIENPETGAIALFPETAKSETEWEERALAMHEAQEVIRLPNKPEENALAARKGRGSAVASFDMSHADKAPNFADSPQATGNHTTVKRGN